MSQRGSEGVHSAPCNLQRRSLLVRTSRSGRSRVGSTRRRPRTTLLTWWMASGGTRIASPGYWSTAATGKGASLHYTHAQPESSTASTVIAWHGPAGRLGERCRIKSHGQSNATATVRWLEKSKRIHLPPAPPPPAHTYLDVTQGAPCMTGMDKVPAREPALERIAHDVHRGRCSGILQRVRGGRR